MEISYVAGVAALTGLIDAILSKTRNPHPVMVLAAPPLVLLCTAGFGWTVWTWTDGHPLITRVLGAAGGALAGAAAFVVLYRSSKTFWTMMVGAPARDSSIHAELTNLPHELLVAAERWSLETRAPGELAIAHAFAFTDPVADGAEARGRVFLFVISTGAKKQVSPVFYEQLLARLEAVMKKIAGDEASMRAFDEYTTRVAGAPLAQELREAFIHTDFPKLLAEHRRG